MTQAYIWYFNLTVGKQRAVKRAVKVLMRAGMSQDTAMSTLFENQVAQSYGLPTIRKAQ